MIYYIKCLVLEKDNIVLDIEGNHTQAHPNLSLISFCLHCYISSTCIGMINMWLKEESDDWPFLCEFMRIIKNKNNTFSFMLDSDYEEHKKNEKITPRQITISEKNFLDLIKNFDFIDQTRPEIAYIIDKDGWIYIDTKLPDELDIEITQI